MFLVVGRAGSVDRFAGHVRLLRRLRDRPGEPEPTKRNRDVVPGRAEEATPEPAFLRDDLVHLVDPARRDRNDRDPGADRDPGEAAPFAPLERVAVAGELEAVVDPARIDDHDLAAAEHLFRRVRFAFDGASEVEERAERADAEEVPFAEEADRVTKLVGEEAPENDAIEAKEPMVPDEERAAAAWDARSVRQRRVEVADEFASEAANERHFADAFEELAVERVVHLRERRRPRRRGLDVAAMRGLYAIVDLERTEERGLDPIRYAEALLQGRPALLQLRAKARCAQGVLAILRELAPRCQEHGVPLVVNDRVDCAALSGATFVHLGQSDMAPSLARRLLPGARVGLSTHTEEELDAALRLAPDYVAYGPVFPTASKANHEPTVGVEGLRRIRARVGATPLVAIGGITLERAEVIFPIADLVAVIADLLPPGGDLGWSTERARSYARLAAGLPLANRAA